MKYTQIQRRTTEGMITIGEIMLQTQPGIFKRLYYGFKLYVRDVTELVLAAADISGKDKHYRDIMEQIPNFDKREYKD